MAFVCVISGVTFCLFLSGDLLLLQAMLSFKTPCNYQTGPSKLEQIRLADSDTMKDESTYHELKLH